MSNTGATGAILPGTKIYESMKHNMFIPGKRNIHTMFDHLFDPPMKMLREHLHEKDGILHSEAPARDHERSLRSGSWVVAIQNRPLGFITKTLEIQNCQTTVDGGEIPHQFIDGYRWCIP